MHSALSQIKIVQEANEIAADTTAYTPIIRRLEHQIDIRQHMLRAKYHTAISPLLPPINHPLFIPTPKSKPAVKYNTLHDTTWKVFISKDWIKDTTGGWDIPPSDPTIFCIDNNNTSPPPSSDITKPIKPPAPNITPLLIHKMTPRTSTTILVQSDMGANTNVTNNLDLLINCVQIDHYPIGGVERERVAITCTHKGYIQW